MADVATINALRNEALQRYASGDLTSPWNIAATTSNPWWEVPSAHAANQNWWNVEQIKPYMEEIVGQSVADVQAQAARDWNTSGLGYSPISYSQYQQAQEALKSAPAGSFLDPVGRIITPGSVIGGYKYTPTTQEVDYAAGIYGQGVTPYDPYSDAVDPAMWQWAGQGPETGNAQQALKAAGVMPSVEWRGTLGPKGLETITNLISLATPGLQEFFGANTLAQSAVQNLVSQGMNETAANALVRGGMGAATGAATGALRGDPLMGAAVGGAGGAAGGAVGSATGSQLGGALAGDVTRFGVSSLMAPTAGGTPASQNSQNAIARTQTPAYNAFTDTTQGVTHQPLISPQFYTPYNVFARS